MTDPNRTEECPVCPAGTQTPGCGHPVHPLDHGAAVSGVLLPARCRSPHPAKVAECGRRFGHPGSHQDGDVVWRKVGDARVVEIPDRVTEVDLERMVAALHVEGAWCGDCDFESGPCSDCRRQLAVYARVVLRVVGIEA